MTTAIERVQEFCDLMEKRDAEALRPYLADDVLYQNCGMPASVGIEAVIANLAGQFSMFPDSYQYVTKNIAGSGNAVLTERLDMIGTPSGPQGVPVMGTFIVEDGKIRRWHDYWDTTLPKKMIQGDDVSTLVPVAY